MSDDPQLKSLLEEWTAPHAPASLGARLERARTPWWRRMYTASIPVPVPLAFGLSLVLVYGAWQASAGATTCGALTSAAAPRAQRICTNVGEC